MAIRRMSAILVAAVFSWVLAPARAATFVWNGGGGDDNWTTGLNWGGTGPAGVNTDDLQLAGSIRLTPVVDTNNPWVLKSLTFNPGAGAFALSGNPLNFTAGGNIIVNSSSNVQTFANEVQIGASGGTINAASGGLIFTGPMTLTGTPFIRGGQAVTISGLISGTGGISRTDPGTLTLSNNANDFTGNVLAASGVISVATIADAGVACALGKGTTITLGQGTWGPADAGTLRYTGATASTNRTILMASNNDNQAHNGPSGRPTIEVATAGTTLTFNGNFDYASGSSAGVGWFLQGAGNGVINGNITTTSAALTKSGTGTWTLNGVNTYTGGTTVNEGTLALGSGGSTGVIRGALTINSGATVSANTAWSLGYNGAANGVSSIAINGGTLAFTGTNDNGGTEASAITMTGGTISGSHFDWYNGITSTPTLTTLASPTTSTVSSGFRLRLGSNKATFDVAPGTTPSGVDLLISGPITSNAADGIIKTGAGTMQLNGANTFTGGTTINQGVVTLGTGGTLANTSAITIAAGATLNLSGAANNQIQAAAASPSLTIDGTLAVTTAYAHTLYATTITLDNGTMTSTGAAPSNYGAYYVGANRTITANGATNTISGTGKLGIGSGAVLTLNTPLATNALNVSTVIGIGANGTAGGLAKTGSGVVTLSGANTYTGTTILDNGVLILGSTGGYSIVGNVQMGNNNTNQPHLRMAAANQFGPGVVMSTGNTANNYARFDLQGYAQTLAGLNSANNSLVVQNERYGGGGTTVPATLTLNGGGTYSTSGYIRDEDDGGHVYPLSIVKDGTGTQTFAGGSITYTGATTVSGGTLKLTDTTAFASPIANSSIVELNATSGLNLVTGAALSGSGTWNKTGTGTAKINGGQAITASGQFNVQAGKLQNDNNSVNWSGNTASLDISAGAIVDLYADAIYVNKLTGLGTITNTYGNVSGYSGGSAYTEKLVVGVANGTSQFDGTITDSGTAGAGAGKGLLELQKVGSGTLTLTGANTYTGLTTIYGDTSSTLLLANPSGPAITGSVYLGKPGGGGSGGTLKLGADNQLTDTSVVTFGHAYSSQHAYFTLDGYSTHVAGLNNGTDLGGEVRNGAATDSTLTLAGTGTYTFGPISGYFGNLSDGGTGKLNIAKSGSGTQTFVGGSINYTGTTTVSGGTLALQDTTGFASPATVNASGALTLSRGTAGFGSRARVSNTITGSGTINVNNTGSGIAGGWVIFNSASCGLSNFTGTVYVNSGVLSMDNIAGAWSGNPDVNVATGGVLAIRAQSISIDALDGGGDVANTWNGHGTAGDTLTVGANNGSGTFSGVIHGTVSSGGTDGTMEQGLVNLVKAGSGTQTLNGNDTYAGTTTVSAGTLLANGTHTGGGAYTVAAGATLGGSGHLGNGSTWSSVRVWPDGTLAPGNSPGTLYTGTLTLDPGSNFDVQLSPAIGDCVDVTGDVYVGGAFLNLSALSSFASYGGSRYVIVQNDGVESVHGTFDALVEGASLEVGGAQFAITYRGGTGNDIVLTSVPEPASMILLLTALPALAARLRRRVRKAA